jgi:hypothetical protein
VTKFIGEHFPKNRYAFPPLIVYGSVPDLVNLLPVAIPTNVLLAVVKYNPFGNSYVA